MSVPGHSKDSGSSVPRGLVIGVSPYTYYIHRALSQACTFFPHLSNPSRVWAVALVVIQAARPDVVQVLCMSDIVQTLHPSQEEEVSLGQCQMKKLGQLSSPGSTWPGEGEVQLWDGWMLACEMGCLGGKGQGKVGATEGFGAEDRSDPNRV